MLVIDVSAIPPEGLDMSEQLGLDELHLEGESELRLAPGGQLQCHVERSEDASVHVQGRLAASLSVECHRCLEGFSLILDQHLDLFFLPSTPSRDHDDEEDVELTDHELVVAYYDGERLDMGEVLREQLLLALPQKSLCREDCRGRCPSCGANLNRGGCPCPPPSEDVDPRLAVLRGLLDPRSN
jgi:uncharacterized protein